MEKELRNLTLLVIVAYEGLECPIDNTTILFLGILGANFYNLL